MPPTIVVTAQVIRAPMRRRSPRPSLSRRSNSRSTGVENMLYMSSQSDRRRASITLDDHLQAPAPTCRRRRCWCENPRVDDRAAVAAGPGARALGVVTDKSSPDLLDGGSVLFRRSTRAISFIMSTYVAALQSPGPDRAPATDVGERGDCSARAVISACAFGSIPDRLASTPP